MDLIASHQQGLMDRLDEEVFALTGRPQDFGQRAIVLHHLYDHSGGAHGWALLEARRQLDTDVALVALRKKVGGYWLRRRRRDEATEALEVLALALGEAAQLRCRMAYRAYRMTGTSALEEEASIALPPELALLLGECHARRRAGMPLSAPTREQLCSLSEDATEDGTLGDAWAVMAATVLGKRARKQVRDTVTDADFARAEQRGWAKLEKSVRNDPALPSAFRINPAQHFYALQNDVVAKRLKGWREAADAEGDTVAVAAPIAA